MDTRCVSGTIQIGLILGLLGCGSDGVAMDAESAETSVTESETSASNSSAEGNSGSGGDGDGDPGDGDPGDGDGDGDGDGGDGDGDPGVCGDGVVGGTEACDDANMDDTDACLSDCTAASCGDGILWVGNEACDDGNLISDDGCSDMCTPELYWVCVEDEDCEPVRILYAPAYDDDPNYRADVAAITGGPVDYHDARMSTPLLMDVEADYDCVITHGGYRYFNRFEMSDLLVGFVDGGGVTALGIGVGEVSAFGLGGLEIMSDSYSPVSTGGSVDPVQVAYSGDGVSMLHTDVNAYGLGAYEVDVMAQGMGEVDGTYDNTAITTGYRPDYAVVYLNGTGHVDFGPSGDWATLTANACSVAYAL